MAASHLDKDKRKELLKYLTKERMEDLRSHLSNIEIANQTGLSLSFIKRLVHKMGIAKRIIAKRPSSSREAPRYASVDDGISLMDMCKQVLGPSMTEDHRGYLLNGRPVNTAKLLESAGLSLGRREPKKSLS
jgi:hypothetical protein